MLTQCVRLFVLWVSDCLFTPPAHCVFTFGVGVCGVQLFNPIDSACKDSATWNGVRPLVKPGTLATDSTLAADGFACAHHLPCVCACVYAMSTAEAMSEAIKLMVPAPAGEFEKLMPKVVPELGNSLSHKQVSVNLGSAAHYDLDNGQTVVIWAAEKPDHQHRKWWLVFPNIGRAGLAVELAHGTLVSWDARVSKHRSTVPDAANGNEYGMALFSVSTLNYVSDSFT